MIKRLVSVLTLSIIISFSAFFAGCSKDVWLAAPQAETFTIDENNVLTWDPVEDARCYSIEILNVDTGEKITEQDYRDTSYSLSGLAEGKYEIRIRALSGSNLSIQSEWSAVKDFQKEYETGCLYTLINNGTEYEITKGNSVTGTIVIEDFYRGKPVTQIKESAFSSNRALESVTIGNNVIRIGDAAFYSCTNLVSVNIPDSVTYIGTAAFQSCVKLKTVNIPEGVTELNKAVFMYCRALEEIELSDNLRSIGSMAFAECWMLRKINIPDSVLTIGAEAFYNDAALPDIEIGDGVETIGSYAFFKCEALSDVTFGESGNLTTIGASAFSGCAALTEINLPEGVTSLGKQAFYQASLLDKVALPQSLESLGAEAFSETKLYESQSESGYFYIDNWLVACSDSVKNSIVKIVANESESDVENGAVSLKSGIIGIADSMFSGAELLEKVSLPVSLLYLGRAAFFGCKNLTEFRVAYGNLKKLGDYTFAFCDLLSTVILNEGMESIGSYAFYSCSRVDNPSYGSLIPESVKRVGSYAFKDTALWESTDEYRVIYAGNWVVGMRNSILDYEEMSVRSVILKGETVGISDYAFFYRESGEGDLWMIDFNNYDNLQAVTGLHNVKYIGEGAFYGRSHLISVQLPDTLEKIEDYTFYGCSSLVSVTVPVCLETVGQSAFYGCKKLGKFDLTESIAERTEIKPYAFYECESLKEVKLGEKTESLGEYAFYGCSSLTDFTVPDSVTFVGERAFSGCTNLETVSLGKGITQISDYMFQDCTALKNVVIPSAVQSVGKYAFYNCSSLSSVTFGENLVSVGDYAFYGAAGLVSLNFPASLVSIGRYSFKGCSELTSVLLTDTTKEIGAYAFFECPKATFYVEAAGVSENWDDRWNASYGPLLYGCVLSEDKSYVVSVTVSPDTLVYGNSPQGISSPEREGYDFIGWSKTADSSSVDVTAEQIAEITESTVLYAVWQQKSA